MGRSQVLLKGIILLRLYTFHGLLVELLDRFIYLANTREYVLVLVLVSPMTEVGRDYEDSSRIHEERQEGLCIVNMAIIGDITDQKRHQLDVACLTCISEHFIDEG